MAMARITLRILQMSVIILAVVLCNTVALNNSVPAANISVKPLWDTAGDETHPCHIEERNTCLGAIVLRGSAHQTCSILVTASTGFHTRLEIPEFVNDDPAFLHIERQGELTYCQNKYVVFNIQDGACNAVLHQERVRLNLQGNVSILIDGVLALDSQRPTCPECNGNNLPSPKVNQTPDCNNVKGYNDKFTCTPFYLIFHTCRLEFRLNCNATLGHRYVKFVCSNHANSSHLTHHDTMIEYTIGISRIDISHNNIISLEDNPFQSLNGLQRLVLENNYLTTLNINTSFKGLKALQVLFLNGNFLTALNVNIFRGLPTLTTLFLGGNQMGTVEVGLFQDLEMLTDLRLGDNQLMILPDGLFSRITNLKMLDLKSNRLVTLNESVLYGLFNLEELDIRNNSLIALPVGLFKGLAQLKELFMHNNRLTKLDSHLFNNLNNLNRLLINDNMLTTFPEGVFNGSGSLEELKLNNNQLEWLGRNTLLGLFNLVYLHLQDNRLTHIDFDIFKDTKAIYYIGLSNNKLTTLPNIKPLTNLYILDVKGNPLEGINHDTFSALSDKLKLIVSQHEICECYAPDDVEVCSAEDARSPYLTCERLLSDRALATLMWIIGINALCGNIYVLIWRKRNTQKYKVQDILLINLAMSDSLMGVYMIIIGCADIYYKDYFPMQSETWRSGIICRISGSLSIASSQASVFFVTLISIDRLINIKFPFSDRKMSKQSTLVAAILIWICSLALGVVPSVLSGIDFKFYANSHVCVGLPLALTKTYTVTSSMEIDLNIRNILYIQTTKFSGNVNGLYYSTALFLGLNCLCFLMILICYIEIVRVVRNSSKQVERTPDMKKQVRLTIKVSAIVLTDFACWSPLVILGILVQTRVITLPPSVFAWSVTFVLPLNSAINPYLYTLAEVISKYRKKKTVQENQNAQPKCPLPKR